MTSDKKARREAAIKKAKFNKKIIISVCIFVVIVFTALIIFNLISSGRPQRDFRVIDVDIDLTGLGDNMIMAEVANILSSPAEYIGMTIKLNGPYYAVVEPVSGRMQNIIAFTEPDACCPPQGFEFIVGDFNNPLPFDFPNPGAKIEVTGVFSTYEKSGFDLYYLAVDDVIILG